MASTSALLFRQLSLTSPQRYLESQSRQRVNVKISWTRLRLQNIPKRAQRRILTGRTFIFRGDPSFKIQLIFHSRIRRISGIRRSSKSTMLHSQKRMLLITVANMRVTTTSKRLTLFRSKSKGSLLVTLLKS